MDMIDEGTGKWFEEIVRALFIEDNAERILKMKTSLHVEDSFIWTFSKNGVYNSQSGYLLLEKSQEPQANTSLSPLEQSLWTNLWKIKTMPKIKHFLWKALAGTLAVLEGLRTRGMATSRVCTACNLEPETICHVLFFCPVAEYTWILSRIPLPPMGLSRSSVFLNFPHLWACIRNENIGEELRNSIPWILWEIWKARNLFVFEGKRTDGPFILAKAQEDAGSWFEANKKTVQIQPVNSSSEVTQANWVKPPTYVVKCNVASSWINSRRSCGVAWVIRDHYGKVLSHSRRSFSAVETQLELDMKSIKWAVEGMRSLQHNKIIFESTSTLAVSGVLQPRKTPVCRILISEIPEALRPLEMWKIQSIDQGRNQVAYKIALSVTETNRHQSYIATEGPSWLSTLINSEAQGSVSES